MLLPNTTYTMPLYTQIRDLLIAQINTKKWIPGDIIPSETQLAKNYNVSQGTVRKAIGDLVNNNVLIRKQGKGTFVADHNVQRALFHFFHIVDQDSNKVIPQSKILSCKIRQASDSEIVKLGLTKKAQVIAIERVRTLDDQVVILETIALPKKLFATLATDDSVELPNMLYALYEKRFGITVHSATEKLRALNASKRDASLLSIPEKSSLLEIERLAITLDKKPIELRISKCNTKHHFYENIIF